MLTKFTARVSWQKQPVSDFVLLFLQRVDQGYTPLGDGRKLCGECMDSMVMHTRDCQPLYREILKFYKNNLGMSIVQEIPMLLVERAALNHAREAERDVSSPIYILLPP